MLLRVVCDNCHGAIIGSRVFCVSCNATSGWTIDLCSKPECISATVVREGDLTKPHYPTHNLVKVRRIIFSDREWGAMVTKAEEGLTKSRSIFQEYEKQIADISKFSNEQGVQHTKAPTCTTCNKVTSQPCWFCLQCKGLHHIFFYIVSETLTGCTSWCLRMHGM